MILVLLKSESRSDDWGVVLSPQKYVGLFTTFERVVSFLQHVHDVNMIAWHQATRLPERCRFYNTETRMWEHYTLIRSVPDTLWKQVQS